MARPIRETPALKGKDAVRFAERIVNPLLSASPKKCGSRLMRLLKQ